MIKKFNNIYLYHVSQTNITSYNTQKNSKNSSSNALHTKVYLNAKYTNNNVSLKMDFEESTLPYISYNHYHCLYDIISTYSLKWCLIMLEINITFVYLLRWRCLQRIFFYLLMFLSSHITFCVDFQNLKRQILLW